jgi:hypothetical protein
MLELCAENMAKFLKFWSNYGYWKSLISALLFCKIAFWLYVYSPKKKGWKRERERERERELLSLHVSGRASNSFITRAKWVLLAFTLLVSETVVQFRAHPVHCQRVQTQLEGGSPDFSRPPKQFQKCFFPANLHPKSSTTPLHKCILLLPSVAAGKRVFCSF